MQSSCFHPRPTKLWSRAGQSRATNSRDIGVDCFAQRAHTHTAEAKRFFGELSCEIEAQGNPHQAPGALSPSPSVCRLNTDKIIPKNMAAQFLKATVATSRGSIRAGESKRRFPTVG
eukprot:6485232-Amphidinium_carterae.1